MTSGCVCPADLDSIVMVEYPGIVRNPDKALETLGGVETIQRVASSTNERLELKFRPSDPLAHVAFGDRVAKKCLVIQIQKNKKTGIFSINVIGKIQTAYRFDTMAEFQWLPMQRTNINPEYKVTEAQLHDGITVRRTRESQNAQYKSILDEILPLRDPFDNTLKTFNQDAPLSILPAIFSRFDTPREIQQAHPKFRNKEMRDEFERQQNLAIVGTTRKKRATMSHLINYADPVPDKPPECLYDDRIIMAPTESNIVPRLKRCFEKQKIWTKAALSFELDCPTIDLKYALPLVAYYYLTGPFRTMWVKYGYDPHRDKSSKRLQALDFRFKPPDPSQIEYARRSAQSHALPVRRNTDKSKSSVTIDLKTVLNNSTVMESLDGTVTGEQLKQMAASESTCRFRRGIPPPARQLTYHLKDIDLDEVQVLVHSNDGQEQEICSERDGWLPEGSIDKIRKMMNKSVQDTLENLTEQLAGQAT